MHLRDLLATVQSCFQINRLFAVNAENSSHAVVAHVLLAALAKVSFKNADAPFANFAIVKRKADFTHAFHPSQCTPAIRRDSQMKHGFATDLQPQPPHRYALQRTGLIALRERNSLTIDV
jgi:hypothetical protein